MTIETLNSQDDCCCTVECFDMQTQGTCSSSLKYSAVSLFHNGIGQYPNTCISITVAVVIGSEVISSYCNMGVHEYSTEISSNSNSLKVVYIVIAMEGA